MSDESPPPSERANNGARPFIALGIFLVLAVVGWFVINSLADQSKIQDCTMSGRKNCAPINTYDLK